MANFTTAIEWALATDQPEFAGRLAGALSRFWEIRGHLQEGERLLHKVLVAGPKISTAVKAKVLQASGWLLKGDTMPTPEASLLLAWTSGVLAGIWSKQPNYLTGWVSCRRARRGIYQRSGPLPGKPGALSTAKQPAGCCISAQ